MSHKKQAYLLVFKFKVILLCKSKLSVMNIDRHKNIFNTQFILKLLIYSFIFVRLIDKPLLANNKRYGLMSPNTR